ncbi:GNAT superfamily N-acetyltransferase [Chromobacterium alkanivorans]|uniref:GNAT family N-acetyltransferase n=1 Tax=Chromobacterium alkanivorans TaxID=1071719 RepID=UPI00216874A8|nr:GNAT family N-acetyltransferase [Chromobacterium alkanivorans]MCS3803166.1 GNAT superfamily N-acetyltransferase [Chromobacterium alkanivorans]MCS3817724.1 GNAT superfamily N-acetyltransferase [Chromobacterium alkanivorans]MCS3872532.1 GNAT superfamily N-acetyltransferase [Chromobacterium alkanivorans]
MAQPLRLRAATALDAERIAALHVASWQQHYRGILPDDYLDQGAAAERLAMWRRRFAASETLWVRLALWRGEPVGFVCLLPDEAPERGVYLDNLHVLAGQQGRGIGRALMAAAAAEALRVAPGRPLFLWAYQANRDACGFYRALGGAESAPCEVDTAGGRRALALSYQWDDPSCLL